MEDRQINEWQKPSVFSLGVIAMVLIAIGVLAYLKLMTVPAALGSTLVSVILWITNGARPPIVEKIGKKDNDDDKSDPPSGGSTPLVVGMALSLLVSGCGYGGTACKVIDIAQANCIWLKYLETDGSAQQVQLTPVEAREFGRAMSKKRAAEKLAAPSDAGAP